MYVGMYKIVCSDFCMIGKENEEMNAFVGLMVACKTVVVIGICGNLTL